MAAMPFGPRRLLLLPDDRGGGLALLLERQAQRDLVLAQTLGAAIRYAPDLDEKGAGGRASNCAARPSRVVFHAVRAPGLR